MNFKTKNLLIFIASILSFVMAGALITLSIISIFMPDFVYKIFLLSESMIEFYSKFRIAIVIYYFVSAAFSVACGVIMMFLSRLKKEDFYKKKILYYTFTALSAVFCNLFVVILLIISLFCNDEKGDTHEVFVSENDIKLKKLNELYKENKVSESEYNEMLKKLKEH